MPVTVVAGMLPLGYGSLSRNQSWSLQAAKQQPCRKRHSMDHRLRAMILALGPTMTQHSAEITLRATALCRRKRVESLSADDLPAIEAAVRDVLRPVASDASIEITIYKLRQLFLETRDGAGC